MECRGSLEDAYDSPFVRDQIASAGGGPEPVQARTGKIRGRLHPQVARTGFRVHPAIFLLALFLTLWGVSFIFREVAIWTGAGIWAVLKMTKFVSVAEEDGKVETIML